MANHPQGRRFFSLFVALRLPDSAIPSYRHATFQRNDPFARKLRERKMGRLVRKPQVPDFDSQVAGLNGVSSGLAMQTIKGDPGDGYLERMVKYVPAEIIAFSMVINAILEQAMKSGGDHPAMAGVPVPVIAAVALVVACLLTPLSAGPPYCFDNLLNDLMYLLTVNACPSLCPTCCRAMGSRRTSG
jgi:hypothetical protein